MPRRSKIQRELHQRLVEEALIKGMPPRQIVRSMAREFQLTLRQARYDLDQVLRNWREQDDQIRQGKLEARDLAIAAARRERELREALEQNDPRRALRAEKDRCKLLGIYAVDRYRSPYEPDSERQNTVKQLDQELSGLYAEAPRNPDGSVVLTAYSSTPPPVEDARYRRAIEHPLGRPITPRRQERLDTLQAAFIGGVRLDQLEQAARDRFALSRRQAREDVLRMLEQLEDDGQRLKHGTHELHSLTLATRRRERIYQMALEQDELKLAAEIEIDRCGLLGLYARLRQPPGDAEQTPGILAAAALGMEPERMIEFELARRDRLDGHRHWIAELSPASGRGRRISGRQPWQPPAEATHGEETIESMAQR